MKTDSTVRSIQIRLFLLLLRGFVAAVVLTLIFVLAATAIVLSSPTDAGILDRLPIVTRLETYYYINGSWDGLAEDMTAVLAAGDQEGLLSRSILVDSNNTIIFYKGQFGTPQIGQVFEPASRDTVIPLVVRNQTVGQLIVLASLMPIQGQMALGLLVPVFFISIFLAVLTIIIGLLLLRRVVNPLAEVIAAARTLARGDLSTRVNVTGPDDLRALSDSFNHMADALERSDRERRNMLADIAHELRTPLTVIRGRLEGIVDGIYPADTGHVAPALEESYLLERLVDDLRLLTLAETRQLPFEHRDTDLNALASHAVTLFRAEAEEKGIRLFLAAAAQPVILSLDPQRTEQVVSNLVGNALRYTPEGGSVWVTVTHALGAVELTVSDNGPGLAESDLPHIFDRFWRAEKSRSRASGGAGLGLAIAKQLVEAQNGTIQARNRLGGGLEVSISFPEA